MNDTLYTFIGEGPIWDALNNLKVKHGTRFGAHCALIELIQSKDVDALDEACETGSAMYLASQLLGQETFQATFASTISNAIRLDFEDGDLTESDEATLRKLLKVAF